MPLVCISPYINAPLKDQYWALVNVLAHFNDSNGSTTSYTVQGSTISFSGTASISTAQKAFGTASASFTSGSATLLGTTAVSFDGDFTVEMSARFTSVTGPQTLLKKRASISQNTPILIYSSGTSLYARYTNVSGTSFTATLTNSLAVNTWYAIAVTRAGNTFRVFLNGNLVGTVAISGTSLNNGSNLVLGGDNNGFGEAVNLFKGFIDELRITTGVARYTASYTPLTQEFPHTA